ncbi:hypothetical protein AB0D32_28870 [Micromonospora sp. NPDC048170]|uniref:hypothetical protein n=1 Tax=Micromonospora sp. NPDC048170 TaxID=3154819 RepID=UPI0033D59524
MTRSIRGSRRAALLLTGMATATGLLLAGCGTGQVSETANKEPSIQGVNLSARDDDYTVRGLLLGFPGIEGYKAGSNAVLSAVIYNDSPDPVTVTVTTDSAREVVITGTGATASPSPTEPAPESPSPTPSGSESASPGTSESPSGSASPGVPESPSAPESPAAPAGEPARVEIPPMSYVRLNTESDRVLQLIGLNESLRSGQNVVVTFDFGNGVTVTSQVPVAVPLTPAAPPSKIVERLGGYEDQEGGGH